MLSGFDIDSAVIDGLIRRIEKLEESLEKLKHRVIRHEYVRPSHFDEVRPPNYSDYDFYPIKRNK